MSFKGQLLPLLRPQLLGIACYAGSTEWAIRRAFNSNECSAPVSANFQWRTLSFVRKDDPRNWPDQAYFVEVQLIRANATGNPALGLVMIGLLRG